MSKVRVIEHSLWCFGLGCVGLVPILGLPAAVFALLFYQRARAESRDQWNPAGGYLYAGMLLAAIGLMCSAVLPIAAMFVHHLASQFR